MNMTFGEALEVLKQGGRVQRAGWNTRGMWVVLIRAEGPVPSPGDNQERIIDACLAMRTAKNTLQPGWLASQADMLAEDWQVL